MLMHDRPKELLDIFKKSRYLSPFINDNKNLPPHSCLAAGCISQTLWNSFHGYELEYGIDDIDFMYYDKSDLSYEAEDSVIKDINGRFSNIPIKIDVKNQARVHLWYESRFGTKIKPFTSIYDAINSFPSTSSTVALFLSNLNFYSKYGLKVIYNMEIRMNPISIASKDHYHKKVCKWKAKWPLLNI